MRRGLVAALLVIVATTGCGSEGNQAANKATPSVEPTIFAEAQTRYSSETAADVLKHSDRIAVVSAVAAKEIAEARIPAARAAAGEVSIGRLVTFEVDRVLWERPGAVPGKQRFDAYVSGWWVKSGERARLISRGSTWIDVGAQYVMPLGYGDGEYVPTDSFAVFPLENGRVSPAEGQQTALARALSGRTVGEVGSTFEKASKVRSSAD